MQKRKSNRYKEYDYSNNGFYFITICTKNNVNYFGNIENNKMNLNNYGRIAENQLLWLAEHYHYIKLDTFIIMSNHVHGIIIINRTNLSQIDFDKRTTQGLSLHNNIHNRQKNLLSKTICAYKTTTSKLIHNKGYTDFHW
jgi:REP element-mobilizing transposase RayT